MRTLCINPDGKTHEVDVSDDHEGGFAADVRAAIGCAAIEAFDLAQDCVAWIDEDGISTHRPINFPATLLAGSFGAPATLRGTTVLSGFDTENGISCGLTEAQLSTIHSRLDLRGAR